MILQKAAAVLLSALSVCFLSGCDITPEPATSSEFQGSTALSNSTEESKTDASPSQSALSESYSESDSFPESSDGTITREDSIPDTDSYAEIPSASQLGKEEYTSLSFLNEEQQQLYQNAADFSSCLFSLPGNLNYLDTSPRFEPQTNGAAVVTDGNYILYQNPYSDFEHLVNQLFTADYLDSLGPIYSEKFIDYNGHLATYADSDMTYPLLNGVTRLTLDNYPDTYRLESADSNLVVFTLISHYDQNWQTDRTISEMDIFTIEYPIRMVQTDDGWRIDEFHTTMYG